MFSAIEVRWLWRKVHDSQDSLVFFGLQVVLAKLWDVFGVLILPQCESFSTEMETRGCSTSLQNGVVLLLGQGGVNSVQVSNSRVCKTPPDLNIPTTITFHCRVIHCSISLSPVRLLTFTLLSLPWISNLESSVKRTFFQLSTVKCWYFFAHPKCLASASETTTRQPSFDSTFSVYKVIKTRSNSSSYDIKMLLSHWYISINHLIMSDSHCQQWRKYSDPLFK